MLINAAEIQAETAAQDAWNLWGMEHAARMMQQLQRMLQVRRIQVPSCARTTDA